MVFIQYISPKRCRWKELPYITVNTWLLLLILFLKSIGDVLLTPCTLALPLNIVERFISLFPLFGKPLRFAFICLLNLERQFKISCTDPG
jgi:hypothetical protein